MSEVQSWDQIDLECAQCGESVFTRDCYVPFTLAELEAAIRNHRDSKAHMDDVNN